MEATVVIPTKNRPEGLIRAVNSVLESSLSGDLFDIVIVNDGGALPAAEVLMRWPSGRVQVISNSRVTGPSGARNQGVQAAQGEIIFFLDDDDQMLEDYMERVLSARRALAMSSGYGFSSLIRGKRIVGLHGSTGMLTSEVPLKHRIGGMGAGFWITRRDFLAVGGLDEGLRVNEDFEFCIRLAENDLNCWYSSEPGVDISPMPSVSGSEMPSITQSSSASERSRALEFILQRHADFLSSHLDVRNRLIERVVKFRARGGDLRGALTFGASHGGPKLAVIVNAFLGLLTSERGA